MKLTIQNRIDAVRKGKWIWSAAPPRGRSRARAWSTSLITFVDGGNLLTKSDAQFGRLADFQGKRIAVIAGTTTERALGSRALGAELVKIRTRDEGLTLLREGQVDALASDRTALIGVVVMGSGARAISSCSTRTSPSSSTRSCCRAATTFRLAVNRQLARIYRSGDIEKIYARWLGPLGPPSILLSATYYIQTISE